MDVDGFLARLRNAPWYSDQVVHEQAVAPRAAEYGELERPLDARLEEALRGRGTYPLYRHQAAAINAAREGRHVVVATGPASGKSLCYTIPLLERALDDPSSRALYLAPTKALAQDQLRSLRDLSGDRLPVRADIFDGDTPGHDRRGIKDRAQVVLTNPDMLHLGILPNHKGWGRLFRNLRYVVLDEAHIYCGIFGSHVANIMRRLRRLCLQYGSTPQFILCSATIANPEALAEELIGLPVTVVDEDCSPFGGKEFLFWNPPLVDEAKTTRKSTISEGSKLFGSLLQASIRTLAFARTRRQVELMYLSVRNQLAETAPELVDRVRPYRGSYLPEERREIERALFNGELLGVTSTNALELGLDIGDLDATILAGYPGSISSTWQQAGRSGRRQEPSLSILVARDDPLDQYLMRHPDFFFGRSHEHALIAPANPYVLDGHLLCAAYEAPLTPGDAELFGETFFHRVESLVERGLLRARQRRWFPAPDHTYPAGEVNIRSAFSGSYMVVEGNSGRVLEHVEEDSVFFQLHPGAVYLHYGEQYLVEELDQVSKTAYVSAGDLPYYTQSQDITDIQVLTSLREREAGAVRIYLGEVEVSNQVVSFKRRAHFSDQILGEEVLDLPPQRFNTVALWFDLPEALLEAIHTWHLDLAGGLHAAEHAAIGVLPLFALCDRNDIGGVSTPLHPDTGRPQIFIYDGHPGGVGIAEKGYDLAEELWAATLRVVEECPCTQGCPSCIQSPKCGSNNRPLDKEVAVMLLQGVLGMGKGR